MCCVWLVVIWILHAMLVSNNMWRHSDGTERRKLLSQRNAIATLEIDFPSTSSGRSGDFGDLE